MQSCPFMHGNFGILDIFCSIRPTTWTEVLRTPSSLYLGLKAWSPDNDSTLHVTKTPAITTVPSLISPVVLLTGQLVLPKLIVKSFSFTIAQLDGNSHSMPVMWLDMFITSN